MTEGEHMKFSSHIKSEDRGGRSRLRYRTIALIVLAVFSTALLAPVSHVFASEPAQVAAGETVKQPDMDQDETRQALSIAEAQHDKVMVLISQGRYDRVLPEVRSILDLKLPPQYESKVAESACIIANGLAENKQYSLAHLVLDEAMRRMKYNENKAAILKIKAYVYKTEGNLDEALRCLERAIELEKQRNRP